MSEDRKKISWHLNRLRQSFCGSPLRVLLLIGADLLWCFAVLRGVFVVCHYFFPAEAQPVVRDFQLVPWMIVVINLFSKCYHGNVLNPGAAINRMEEIRRLALSVCGAYVLGYLFWKISIPGRIFPLWPVLCSAMITIAGFPVMRFAIRYCMKKAKIGQTRIFIAGAGKSAQTIGEEIEVSVYYGYEIVGYFDDDVSRSGINIRGKKWLGRTCDAPRLAEKYNVHSIICCLPPVALPRIVKSYTRSFHHVLVIPSSSVLPITAVYPVLIGFIGGFEFQNRILFLFPRIIKRLLEFLFAVCCVIFLLPLFMILALLVKLSGPGPVFYTAKRLGQGGREIKVFKFRTMYPDAEDRLETLLEENPEMKAEWENNFKLRHDPRVTRIGRFLRKTSLDELPQFINVLRGEMAIIGPRPIVPDEVKHYGDAYEFFKRVRPGITGLWQVSGRNNLDYDERVALDMFYVMNWSVWLDWFILWKTVLVMAMCKGSY